MRFRLARATAAAACLLLAIPAGATVYGVPRLRDLAYDGNTIAFVQPDGTAVILDLASGRVVERRGAIRGMPLEPVSCNEQGACILAAGVLSQAMGPSGAPVMELRSASGTVQGEWPSRFARLWQANGMLLMERTNWGASTLTSVELATLKPAWTYVYPSLTGPLPPFASSLVDLAVEAMQKQVGLGTAPGVIVLDPDPWGQSRVKRALLAGRTLLGLLFAAWIAVTVAGMAAARRERSAAGEPLLAWAAVLLAALSGALVCVAWVVDFPLLVGAGLLFLVSWGVAKTFEKQVTATRIALRWIVATTLVIGVGLPMAAACSLATMR